MNPVQSINTKGIFIPLMPLLEDRQALSADTEASACPILSDGDVKAFLGEHRRTLDEKLSAMAETFPNEEAGADRLMCVRVCVCVRKGQQCQPMFEKK